MMTRTAVRTPKAAAIAGIIFAVLLTASLILTWVAVPRHSDQAGGWVLDGSNRRLVVIALNLTPFAGIAFLWFIGVARDRIGEHEDRFFSTVFLGSGLLFVAMLFVSGAVAGGLVVAPGSDAVAPSEAVWGYGGRIIYSLITVYAMRMAAVFMMSSTTLLLRLGLVPRWFAIGGYVAAVVLLLTSGSVQLLELVFPFWVLALSVHILIVTFRLRRAEVDEAAAASLP